MTEELVTIATFIEPIQAHICQARLEAEGVESYIFDENFAGTYWLITQAFGGAKLQVKETEAERALEILKQHPGFENSLVTAAEPTEIQCPQCQSANVYYEKISRPVAFLFILLLGFPLPFLKRKWKCYDCGCEWKNR